MWQYADDTPRVFGQAGINETIVFVRWAWIMLPFGCCLLGLVFLAITIFQTHARRLPLWKSGKLPLILHGIGPPRAEGSPSNPEPMTTSAMQEQAQDMLIEWYTGPVDHTLRIRTLTIEPIVSDQQSKPQIKNVDHEPVKLPRKPVSQDNGGAKRSQALRQGQYTPLPRRTERDG